MKTMPREVTCFIQREVYLSRGCFTAVPDGADTLGADRGIARKGFWLLSPVSLNFTPTLKKRILLLLWTSEGFVKGYKKDLGEEVRKERVTTPYLKQEAEFTACLSEGGAELAGRSLPAE